MLRITLGTCLMLFATALHAQPRNGNVPADVLSEAEWEEVNESVEQALRWLASEQQSDGSFPTQVHGQPGVTGLVVLAFLTQGHLPGEGQYGKVLDRSIDYIADCQKPNGLLAKLGPNGPQLTRHNIEHRVGVAASYNHAIAGLVLSETYAMAGSERVRSMQPVIERALDVTCQMQDWPKDIAADQGGWRYVDDDGEYDSDLSVTGWQLMFMRSAKNAGFDIEQRRIERAIGYVRRTFRPDMGSFCYKSEPRPRSSRGLAGAGILALAHSGMHHTEEAQQAGEWILSAGFDHYNAAGRVSGESRQSDRYFYGLLTCSQAMYQLGDDYWSEFFPPMSKVLVRNQNADGSWDRESRGRNSRWGNAYTTAIGVIALNASNQLLPIFQR